MAVRCLLLFLCVAFASVDVSSSFRTPAASFSAAGRRTQLTRRASALNSEPGVTSARPWYSDPNLNRDRRAASGALNRIRKEEDTSGKIPLVDDEIADGRFLLSVEGRGMFAIDEDGDGNVKPLYLVFEELVELLGNDAVEGLLLDSAPGHLLAWVGKSGGTDHWAVHLPDDAPETKSEDGDNTSMASGRGSHPIDARVRRLRTDLVVQDNGIQTIFLSPLREFGDALVDPDDAALCALANGLIEFHRAHQFCGRCGAKTEPIRAAGSRRCTAGCKGSVHPRIDAAAIMLVTSTCGDYALLGRKSFWPIGRYSTLSGFADVGETLEGCVVRETAEEGGVAVDPSSVEFILSQPWPFPRSLMVGFRCCAEPGSGCKDEGVVGGDGVVDLPPIIVQEEEMDSIKWFHRDYVRKRIAGGSTAMGYEPTKEEREFHIPGKASLARILISQWANEKD